MTHNNHTYNMKKADEQIDKAWAHLCLANQAMAHILQETGELELPNPMCYKQTDVNGNLVRSWAVKARCKYGLRIEVLLAEDADEDIWEDLSNNETFFNENLISLHAAMNVALNN